jgi:osmotically-inducible protein OsmY
MKTDSELQREAAAVLAESGCDEPEHIEVTVHEGIVKLSGYTCSYREKYRIEDAIRLNPEVAGVVNDIEVRIPNARPLTDEDMRRAVDRALRTEVPTVCDRLHAQVHDGEVTLTGSVAWSFLRERAENAIRRLAHVSVFHNAITLEPEALSREVAEAITRRLQGASPDDTTDVSVTACEGRITLLGHLHSPEQRRLAEQAAWSVHGVTAVDNQIT